MNDPTDPRTFHAALRALLTEHQVMAQLGPRTTPDGTPVSEIVGEQSASVRKRLTTITAFLVPLAEAQGVAWIQQLIHLPGVTNPWPYCAANTLGVTTAFVHWLDGSALPPRPPGDGRH